MLQSGYMKFNLKIGQLEKVESKIVVVFGWSDQWFKETEGLDKKIGGILDKEAIRREFKTEVGKILEIDTQGKIPAQKVWLLGLGKKEEYDGLVLRQAFAALAKKIKQERAETIAWVGLVDMQAAVEGMILGGYEFKKYKTKEEEKPALAKASAGKEENEVTILVKDARELVSVKENITRGEIYSQATIFCRDLVNEPSSVTTPTYLAGLAEKITKKEKFSAKIFEKPDLEKLSMGALLGVARGSDEPVKFIKIEYKGGNKKLILVGKGITFDTGGLSLKPQEGMETMKMDMAGAAAILAIFSVLDKIRPKFHIIGLIPCTENMPSGKAIKPGDIVKAYNGKTIEVLNTDAEGRLILADALAYGATLKPDLMIDLATLTGACIVALGEDVAGLFSDSEDITAKLRKAAEKVGEKFWPMPLEKRYKELLKSEVADIKNVSGKKYGGAITAALFLQEFVGNIPWVHLDIAGPAWQEKGTDLIPKGGSGFGVRTILNFLQNL